MAANAHLLTTSSNYDEDSGADSDVPGSLSRHNMNNEHVRALAYRNLRHSTDSGSSDLNISNRSLVWKFYLNNVYYKKV